MLVYNYDEETKLYTGSEEAYLDPEASKQQGQRVYFLPQNATFDVPPEREGYAAKYQDKSWVLVVDNRGKYYVNADMKPVKVTKVEDVPAGYAVITEEQAQTIMSDDLYYIWDEDTTNIIVNPNYEADKLKRAKDLKYSEALSGAKAFIDTEALYRYDENNTIEATDGNIGKLTAYALGFQAGMFETVEWTSKEDNVLTLNAEDCLRVLTGLGTIQGDIWNVQYIVFKTAIDEAATVEAVNAIVIEYNTGE